MLAQTAHTLGEEMRCAVGSRLNDQIWRMASTCRVQLGAHSTLGFIHSAARDYILGTVTLNLVYTWNYLGSIDKSPCQGPARPNAAESQGWDQASLFFTSCQAHSAGPYKWRTTALGPQPGWVQYGGSLNQCLIKLDRCFYPKPQDKDPKECLSNWLVIWQLRENINQGPPPKRWTQKTWQSSPGQVCLGSSLGETTPRKEMKTQMLICCLLRISLSILTGIQCR